MPPMEPPYPHTFTHPMSATTQPFAPMYPAQQAYDSAAVYGLAPVSQPPPPPKWSHTKGVQGKRGGYSNKQNFRVPSTKVNIKKLRQQNAKGARHHFKGEPVVAVLNVCCEVRQGNFGDIALIPVGSRAETPRSVPPAPYNSNTYLCKQTGRSHSAAMLFVLLCAMCADTCFIAAARRDGHRGRGKHHLVRKRSDTIVREQTPSTIQQTPNMVSERLRVQPTEAGWTAGSDTLTSAEVAMGNNFDPLGELVQSFWYLLQYGTLLNRLVSEWQ